MYDSDGNVVAPRIPWCCDNPSESYREGVTCGYLCHYLTDEDLASIPDVSTSSPDTSEEKEDNMLDSDGSGQRLMQYLEYLEKVQPDIGPSSPRTKEMFRPVTAEDVACPECGGLLDREVVTHSGVTLYGPPWCIDPACDWESPRFLLPPWSDERDENGWLIQKETDE